MRKAHRRSAQFNYVTFSLRLEKFLHIYFRMTVEGKALCLAAVARTPPATEIKMLDFRKTIY